MSTYVLFSNILSKYDIKATMVEAIDLTALKAAITDKTRFIYLETIGNPKMDVPDLAKATEVAHAHDLPLLVDNTLATPYLCRPLELGADLVIHSTTKYLCGHGNAFGGAVIDGGRFNWDSWRFPDFAPFIERKGPLAYRDKIWREHHINFGTTLVPFHSYLTMLGFDTLALRMERHLANTQVVAECLNNHQTVQWVNYVGLDSNSSQQPALTQFHWQGFGALLTFGLKDQEQCFSFINELDKIYHLANLGDCKTMVIHPFSSQYLAFPEQTKADLAITPDLIRLAIGIEAVDDIIADIDQALAKI